MADGGANDERSSHRGETSGRGGGGRGFNCSSGYCSMAPPNVSIAPTLDIKQVGQRRRGSEASLIANAILLLTTLSLLTTLDGHISDPICFWDSVDARSPI